MLVWWGNYGSFIAPLQVCPYLVKWSLLLVWDSVGDAEDSSLSPFCMVELVGDSIFKCLKYGSGVSYVVNLKGTQCSNIWGHWKNCGPVKVGHFPDGIFLQASWVSQKNLNVLETFKS